MGDSILRKFQYNFIFIVGGLLVLLFIMENVNGRFWLHDLEVYYSASRAFLEGNSPYGSSFGLPSGYYKYSPFALIFFAPLALLPFAMAKVVYFFIIAGLLIFLILDSRNTWQTIFSVKEKYFLSIAILAIIICGTHLFREFHLGNVNLLLLFIFYLSFQFIAKKKIFLAGILIAIGILIKPHFIVLIPLLVMRREFKVLGSMALFVVLGLSLPILFGGYEQNLLLHREWVTAMAAHNASLVSAQDTIYAMVNLALSQLSLSSGSMLLVPIVLAVVAIMIFIFVIRNIYMERKYELSDDARSWNFRFEYFWIIGLIPNLVLTDSEHFLLSLPMILFILHYLFLQKSSWVLLLAASFGCLLYGGNWGDLLGDSSAWVSKSGLLGLGDLIILISALYILHKHQRSAYVIGAAVEPQS